MKALALVGGLLAIGLIFGIVQFVSAANYGNRTEKSLTASYNNLDNILGQYSLKVTEIASVSEAYKDDIKEVFVGAIEGRYGADGSKAMFQFLKEQNPNFDSSLYTKIQQVMEAGRNEFQNSQTAFLDQKRAYETELGYLWRGFWLNLAGYPKIDLLKMKPVTSQHSRDAFETGIDKGVQIRKKD